MDNFFIHFLVNLFHGLFPYDWANLLGPASEGPSKGNRSYFLVKHKKYEAVFLSRSLPELDSGFDAESVTGAPRRPSEEKENAVKKEINDFLGKINVLSFKECLFLP